MFGGVRVEELEIMDDWEGGSEGELEVEGRMKGGMEGG